MNIEEVRLKLVQQIIDRGCQEPDTIRKLIEPIAKYVVTGDFDNPLRKHEDISGEFFRYDGDMQDKDGDFYVPTWAQDALKAGDFIFLDEGHLHIKTEHGYTRIAVGSMIKKCPDGKYVVKWNG